MFIRVYFCLSLCLSVSVFSCSTKVTNVNIEDVNDNVPSFLNDSFSVTTEEFYGTSVTSTKSLDVVIIVEDLDEVWA